jgi:hypothetical protein
VANGGADAALLSDAVLSAFTARRGVGSDPAVGLGLPGGDPDRWPLDRAASCSSTNGFAASGTRSIGSRALDPHRGRAVLQALGGSRKAERGAVAARRAPPVGGHALIGVARADPRIGAVGVTKHLTRAVAVDRGIRVRVLAAAAEDGKRQRRRNPQPMFASASAVADHVRAVPHVRLFHPADRECDDPVSSVRFERGLLAGRPSCLRSPTLIHP